VEIVPVPIRHGHIAVRGLKSQHVVPVRARHGFRPGTIRPIYGPVLPLKLNSFSNSTAPCSLCLLSLISHTRLPRAYVSPSFAQTPLRPRRPHISPSLPPPWPPRTSQSAASVHLAVPASAAERRLPAPVAILTVVAEHGLPAPVAVLAAAADSHARRHPVDAVSLCLSPSSPPSRGRRPRAPRLPPPPSASGRSMAVLSNLLWRSPLVIAVSLPVPFVVAAGLPAPVVSAARLPACVVADGGLPTPTVGLPMPAAGAAAVCTAAGNGLGSARARRTDRVVVPAQHGRMCIVRCLG
jgi:hypothetical protein